MNGTTATMEENRVEALRGDSRYLSALDPQSLTIWRRLDHTGVPLLAARLILGGMFLYTGFHKISDPVGFLKQLRMYQMLPEGVPLLLNSIAIILPWMEVVTGTVLILGVVRRGAALIQLVMLVVFTGAILLRALHIVQTEGTGFFQIVFDCGCGSGPVTIWIKLVTNAGLCLLTFIPLYSRSRRFCLGR